jgi:transcriptional regulator with GAF, ATPase, and Fis domain
MDLGDRIGDVIILANAALDAPLARVWLNGPGDICPECPMRAECPDQTRCLHLVASGGVTQRTDGPFRRFPLGARKVGEVAITRTPCVVSEGLAAAGLAEPAWLLTHRIRSFAALPIEHGDRCLGVLALFSRRTLGADDLRLLESAARSAAAIVAGVRERAAREIVRPGADAAASADPTGDPGSHEPRPGAPAYARELRTLAAIERDAIERVLAHTAGRVSGPRGAAKILGMKPTTLESRMKKLGVRKPARGRRR